MAVSVTSLRDCIDLVGRHLSTFTYIVFPFHAAAWEATAKPVDALLNAPDQDEKRRLALLWQSSNQSQLNSIAVTGALIASVVASGFTWPALTSSSWIVTALWYISLVFALTSVSIATQQAVALSRLSSHPRMQDLIHCLLAKKQGQAGSNARSKPSLLQQYIWQIPVSLLSGSLYFFITGLAVLVWNKSKSVHLSWTGDTKIVTVFMIALAFAVFSYVLSAIGIYKRIGEAEQAL